LDVDSYSTCKVSRLARNVSRSNAIGRYTLDPARGIASKLVANTSVFLLAWIGVTARPPDPAAPRGNVSSFPGSRYNLLSSEIVRRFMPFCFVRSAASATRLGHRRGGSRERGFSLRTDSSARFYELMSISVPDGTPEELIETAEAVAGYVTAAGGEVLRSSNDSPWGRRRLAYPIRHHSADLRDGFYTLYHFQIQPEAIDEIEREILLNERIIRHLLLQLDNEPVFAEEEEASEGEAAEGAEASTEAEAPGAAEAANEPQASETTTESAAEATESTASEEG